MDFPCSRAFPSTGNSRLAKIPMIPMIARSSINVNGGIILLGILPILFYIGASPYDSNTDFKIYL